MALYRLKIDKSGKIYLPKALREKLDVSMDCDILVEPKEDNRATLVITKRSTPTSKDFAGILELTQKEQEELMGWKAFEVGSKK